MALKGVLPSAALGFMRRCPGTIATNKIAENTLPVPLHVAALEVDIPDDDEVGESPARPFDWEPKNAHAAPPDSNRVSVSSGTGSSR